MTFPEYDDHPLASIFPLMSADELADLAGDIGANGLQEPIWLYEGKVLDGRNRYRACKTADTDPRVKEYRGSDPVGFIVSHNLRRRHLTESQRALCAARIATARQGERTDREPSANLQKVRRADAAELFKVSERTVASAAKVVESGIPELAEMVERGEIAASVAAVVADLPKAVQRSTVKGGPEKVREVAKAGRSKPEPAPELTPEPEPTDESAEDESEIREPVWLTKSPDDIKKSVALMARKLKDIREFFSHLQESPYKPHVRQAAGSDPAVVWSWDGGEIREGRPLPSVNILVRSHSCPAVDSLATFLGNLEVLVGRMTEAPKPEAAPWET